MAKFVNAAHHLSPMGLLKHAHTLCGASSARVRNRDTLQAKVESVPAAEWTPELLIPHIPEQAPTDPSGRYADCELPEPKGRDTAGTGTVYVKTLTGKTVRFADLPLGSTAVHDVHCKFEAVEHVPVDQQRLITAGKMLHGHAMLSDYNITDGAVLHMVLRMRGGMFHVTTDSGGGGNTKDTMTVMLPADGRSLAFNLAIGIPAVTTLGEIRETVARYCVANHRLLPERFDLGYMHDGRFFPLPEDYELAAARYALHLQGRTDGGDAAAAPMVEA